MGEFARSFRDLDVYQNALGLAFDINILVKTFPKEERYALSDQMRRASMSVCLNTAEAWRKRRYKAAFIAKLSDSEAEAAEVQACLDLAKKFQYLDDVKYKDLDSRYEQVIAQLITMSNQADKWCRSGKNYGSSRVWE